MVAEAHRDGTIGLYHRYITELGPVAIMGKRKSSKKPPPKRKVSPLSVSSRAWLGKENVLDRADTPYHQNEALSSTFACLFCNHEDAVTVKLEKKLGVGMLECKVCSQKFQCGIHCKCSHIVMPRQEAEGRTLMAVIRRSVSRYRRLQRVDRCRR